MCDVSGQAVSNNARPDRRTSGACAAETALSIFSRKRAQCYDRDNHGTFWQAGQAGPG
jgi:hypothetical protein